MNLIKQKFGKRIRELRKSFGYTQEQLAEIIGMETPNISKMENGLHFPQLDNLNKLALAFNIEIMDLFNFAHHNTKEILISEIKNFTENANNKDLEILYQFIKILKTSKR